MLARIAWRNVWRNKGRSGVVIGAMILGIWALSFGGGFMRSFLVSYIQSSIKHETSNGQFHHPEFGKDFNIQYTITDASAIIEALQQRREITGIVSRSVVSGMVSSTRQAVGVKIVGTNPADEAQVTELDSLISDGDYFANVSRNPVLIGDKLADKLQVKVRSKIVLTFQDINGNITAGSFRVAGILHATSLAVSEGTAYVQIEDLNRLLGLDGAVHEIAYTTREGTDDQALADDFTNAFPEDKVESWRELAPALVFMEQWLSASLQILIVIIMLALAFGIVNTMLMAVLERVRELGMLMALGMKKGKVFMMILIETVLLSTAGGPLGLLAGYLTIRWLGERGIDLTNYSEGLEAIGYESILYPTLHAGDYIQIVIGVIVTAFLASIYPAWKAIRYKPVEALHTI